MSNARGRAFQFLRCDENDADIYYIKAYFGLKDSFPMKQLVCQDAHMKKVYFISKELSDYIYNDPNHDLNLINLGVLVF